MTIQSAAGLDSHYTRPDPWDYQTNPHDQRRKSELLALLPVQTWQRVLDIGCGDGYVTFDLPGTRIIGMDISAAAIGWAEKHRSTLSAPMSDRFQFEVRSVFELDAEDQPFDLVVITGVLYQQYIGCAFSVVRERIDALLAPGGCLVSCHIDGWKPPRFAYTLLDTALYPYRDYNHRLEVYRK
jgi:SAM-dependent methyltransferase